MDKLIENLIKAEPTLNIVLDSAPNTIIVPVILDEGSTDDPKKIGKLEYQVSDGMAGKRSMSSDVYSWKEAKAMALKMETEIA